MIHIQLLRDSLCYFPVSARQRDQQLQEALAHKEEEVSDVRSQQDALQSRIRRALVLAHSPIIDPDSCFSS